MKKLKEKKEEELPEFKPLDEPIDAAEAYNDGLKQREKEIDELKKRLADVKASKAEQPIVIKPEDYIRPKISGFRLFLIKLGRNRLIKFLFSFSKGMVFVCLLFSSTVMFLANEKVIAGIIFATLCAYLLFTQIDSIQEKV